MAIFLYDKDLKKVVPVDEIPVDKKISNYINMRKTLSGTTQIEFSYSDVESSANRMKEANNGN
tara:strand:- start:411 stop:599 length:189 start_codon:yes stop_codon:yes gene_type:complete